MNDLVKGGNSSVSGSILSVAARWRAVDKQIDEIGVAAFLLRADGKVAGDVDIVFYGQLASGDGAVRVEHLTTRTGAHSELTFAVSLPRLAPEVERIVFAGTIHEAASKGLSFAQVEHLEICVSEGEFELVRFVVPTVGATETALILGELYRRSGTWKFRAVGQGFNGGLGPLATSFGIEVADPIPPTFSRQPAPAIVPPPRPAPKTDPSISLSKITLDKSRPRINLAKNPAGFGEIKINLDWNQRKGASAFRQRPIDLDVGCLFETQDGYKGAGQALGNSFGSFKNPPYIEPSGDDRTGSAATGEWIRINGCRWNEIRRALLYAFIYEGVPNWAATDGVATVHVPGSAPIEVRLEEDGRLGLCAIALIENVNGEMSVSRQVRYFKGHSEMDDAFHWGLRWKAASNCLAAERCWDQARWAVAAYAWRFDGLGRRRRRRRGTA